MGSMVSAELRQDVLDATLHCLYGDRESIGNLLVRLPLGNEPEDIDFTVREGVVCRVFGDSL
jgi:hypothetical protein